MQEKYSEQTKNVIQNAANTREFSINFKSYTYMILLIKFILDSLILFFEIQEFFKTVWFYVYVCFFCTYICVLCVGMVPVEIREGLDPVELGLTDGSEPCVVLGYSLGALLRTTC